MQVSNIIRALIQWNFPANITWNQSVSARYEYFTPVTVVAKFIPCVRDKMSGRPSALCRTFSATVRHFSQLMTGKYQLSFLFSLPNFYVYWTLLDKMSGKVLPLCRTSAEVCRTCPACPAYFAITAVKTHWGICSVKLLIQLVSQQSWLGCVTRKGP